MNLQKHGIMCPAVCLIYEEQWHPVMNEHYSGSEIWLHMVTQSSQPSPLSPVQFPVGSVRKDCPALEI